MKITIFISALSGGGAERVTCNLANYLTDFGHDVEILTMGEAEAAEPLRMSVKYTPLLLNEERSHSIVNNGIRIFRLYQYMKKQSVDAYVVMLPMTIQLMLRFSKLTKAPIIVSERADPTVYSQNTQRNLQKLASRAGGWIFQTDEARAWYEPYLKGVPHNVIPNAINPSFLRQPYRGEREKVIVGAGRLNDQKNFALLISSFARIAERFPEHKLVIYGKGSLLESLQGLAKEKGVGDRVEFPGYVPDMPERLEKASMFVLSSDYEGMPNALMEAMALGVPCVSTDCGGGGARFLIRNGENGIMVPLRDEDALADAMACLLSDNELSAKVSENGCRLRETLAPEKIYGKWEALIKETVSRSKEGTGRI